MLAITKEFRAAINSVMKEFSESKGRHLLSSQFVRYANRRDVRLNEIHPFVVNKTSLSIEADESQGNKIVNCVLNYIRETNEWDVSPDYGYDDDDDMCENSL